MMDYGRPYVRLANTARIFDDALPVFSSLGLMRHSVELHPSAGAY